MYKKLLIFLTVLLFLLVSVIALFLIIKLKEKKVLLTPVNENISIGDRKIPISAGDSIRKGTLNTGKSIFYDIEGNFQESLSKQDPILTGKFIIKGDSLKRKIPVYIGYLNGKTVFGRYTDSFRGSSTWEMVDTKQALSFILPNQEVIIRVVYTAKEGEAGNQKIKEEEEILDSLIMDLKNEEFKYQIPTDFAIVADRIGIIK